ncbi:MAG: D-glycero-beta-D-manno-heptose 1-phosphate adenylyltransferase [Pirellulales bacterium]
MSLPTWDGPTCDVKTLLGAMAGRRIAVVGDPMLDAYLTGPLERVSPEAPVPVFEVHGHEFKLGGAANVAVCLAALGADVQLCGVVGADTDGERLIQLASQMGIGVSSLLADSSRPTTCKTRVVARNQQVIRLDRESRAPLVESVEHDLVKRLAEVAQWAEGMVLSDYSKGVLTLPVCRAVIEAAGDRPVVVDPKKLPWDRFRGVTVLKPNRLEAEQFAGVVIDSDASAEQAAHQMAASLDVSSVLITRGAAGMTLAKRDNAPHAMHFPAQLRELVDVTGAGDVVAATLTTALAAGISAERAAWLANVAAGIKVGKFGAAAVRPTELMSAVDQNEPAFAKKVLTRDEVTAQTALWRQRGKRVVFTNGCFDLLHVGHVSYLERSRRLGHALVVGINSDASVRRLKGPGRPIQPESDRAQIVASQASVDAVVVFDEDTPLDLIQAIRPDVLTKGADYRNKEAVVGWPQVESWGGQVVLIQLVDGRSTTKLVQHAA